MPAARVRNLRSCHNRAPGNGLAVGDLTESAGIPGLSPSGNSPICCGVRENSWSASTHIVAPIATATRVAAFGKPRAAIAMTHSGEKIMPPMLAPL